MYHLLISWPSFIRGEISIEAIFDPGSPFVRYHHHLFMQCYLIRQFSSLSSNPHDVEGKKKIKNIVLIFMCPSLLPLLLQKPTSW